MSVDVGRGVPCLGSDLGLAPVRDQWSRREMVAADMEPRVVPRELS